MWENYISSLLFGRSIDELLKFLRAENMTRIDSSFRTQN